MYAFRNCSAMEFCAFKCQQTQYVVFELVFEASFSLLLLKFACFWMVLTQYIVWFSVMSTICSDRAASFFSILLIKFMRIQGESCLSTVMEFIEWLFQRIVFCWLTMNSVSAIASLRKKLKFCNIEVL